MPLDGTILYCALSVMAGACVQGMSGMGFALLAAPLVALARPDLVPGPMLVLGGAVAALAALREWRSIDYRGAGIAVGARVAGSIAAGLVIGLLPRSSFALVFAGLILAAVLLSLTRWRVAATPAALAGAGFASGFMGTITSVGTPPMGIVLQNADPARLRATIGAFLVAGTIASIAVLAVIGRFGWKDVKLSLVLLVPMALGFLISTPFVKRVTAAAARRLVLGVSALAAAILLVQHA